MVIIFSFLELLLVGAAFYYVSWKLSYRELLTFEGDRLLIEKGVYRPRKKWRLDTAQLSFKQVQGRHKLDTSKIYIVATQDIALGEFLVEEDIQTLKSYLLRAGLKYKFESSP